MGLLCSAWFPNPDAVKNLVPIWRKIQQKIKHSYGVTNLLCKCPGVISNITERDSWLICYFCFFLLKSLGYKYGTSEKVKRRGKIIWRYKFYSRPFNRPIIIINRGPVKRSNEDENELLFADCVSYVWILSFSEFFQNKRDTKCCWVKV